MKNKFLILGLIALMLAGGLVLASCGPICPGNAEGDGAGKCHRYGSGQPYNGCTNQGCIVYDTGGSGDINCDC